MKGVETCLQEFYILLMKDGVFIFDVSFSNPDKFSTPAIPHENVQKTFANHRMILP